MAMGYCDPVAKEVLSDVCLHDMLEEYRIFLKSLSFPSFSMVVAKRTNEFVRRTSKSSAWNRSNLIVRSGMRKMPMITALEKGEKLGLRV